MLIADKIIARNNFNYSKIKIDNITFLENLVDIILLNNGSPSHWEIFEAAKAASIRSKYLVSGFMGDPYAGKGKHHYIFSKIKNSTEYGNFTFNKASEINSYKRAAEILNKYGIFNMGPIAELSNEWVHQYQSINSDDIDVIGAEGLLRTRGIGRVIPTFQQARLYAIPVYPYIDLEVLNAYLTIPSIYLRGEIAHLKQISDDKQFNQFPTTRFPISAKNEERYLKVITILRKIDYKKRKAKVSPIFKSYNFALRKTLQKMNNVPERFIDDLIPDNIAFTKDYYNIIANIISMIRIQDVYFNNKIEIRKDLKILNYKNEYLTQKKQMYATPLILAR